ncbi:SDR family NAD(P)-dependent oxidoreductase [Microbacterium lacus]|uniref:SDR family NAD(P)-dependent oxidoreductase n=1 Tax=Microbacterium lacus TaxID=415217 RepID=UPI00384F0FA2
MRDSATKGTILLLSSVAAKEARVDYLPYNASKIAVLHIMWSMAKILGPFGISVNAVNPGPVNMPMWAQLADSPVPLGQLGTPAPHNYRCNASPNRPN